MAKNFRNYIKLQLFTIEEVLNFIKQGKEKAKLTNNDKIYLDILGYKVKVNSTRLLTYTIGTICVSCGTKGTHFWLEFPGDMSCANPHFNLYGMNCDGSSEIMMTSDHIIPKSKGGSNGLSNRQPMCVHCNQKKGNRMIANHDILKKKQEVKG